MSEDQNRKRKEISDNSLTNMDKQRKTDQNVDGANKINPVELPSTKTQPEQNLFLASIIEALQHKTTVEIMSKHIVAPIVMQFEETILDLRSELKARDSKIKRIENDLTNVKAKLAEVEDKLEYTRKENNILIDGIEEETNEDIHFVATNFIKSKLGIDIKSYELTEAYRVGRRNPEKPRRILTRFSSLGVKNAVYRQRLNLRNSDDPLTKKVFINEDLTKAKQEILYEARQLKKAKKIANAWTRDGQVYIKVDGQDGPTEIKHKTHLNKFKDALKITKH